jgi:putative ATPase
LATSPKSNSAYNAINDALALVEKTGNLPVPLHLRNAPTKLLKDLNYGKEYQYAHDFPNHFVAQQYMPDALVGKKIWEAQPNASEAKMDELMKKLWGR